MFDYRKEIPLDSVPKSNLELSEDINTASDVTSSSHFDHNMHIPLDSVSKSE